MALKSVKILSTLLRPFRALPAGFHYSCGRVVSWFLKRFHYRRDVAMVNLARSFPEKKYGELEEICNSFYDHLGDIFAETVLFGGCTPENGKLTKYGFFEIENVEEFLCSYNKSPSVMLLGSHLGNWEIIGGVGDYVNLYAGALDSDGERIGISPDRYKVVYKKVKNEFWDEFMNGNRTSPYKDFDGYLESRDVLREVILERRNKNVYLFITDQFPYSGAARHEIPSFMSQKTYTMTAAFRLAQKYGHALFYLGIEPVRRDGVNVRGKYIMKFVKLADDASKVDIDEMINAYYKHLEADIRNAPEMYLWTHKRWK